MRPHFLALVLFGTMLVSVALAVPARAGTYEVGTCNAAEGHVNRSWVYESNAPAKFDHGTICPGTPPFIDPIFGRSSSGNYVGLYARTLLVGSMPLTGEYAQWSFRATPGTRISHFEMDSWLGKEGGSGWQVYGRADGALLPGETCEPNVNADDCNAMGTAGSIDAASLSYGFVCQGAGGCPTGSSIHAARVAIWGARVTITDPDPPTLTTADGVLVTGAGWRSGVEGGSLTATDASGIQEMRAYVDGIRVASTPRTCDYASPRPCSDAASPVAVAVDTTQLPDGAHTVQLAAVDAAGNETRTAARTLLIDNQPPPAPGLAWLTAVGARLTASWGPVAGDGAPITAARYVLCRAGGGCLPEQRVELAGDRVLSVQAPHTGAWRVRFWLEDALGHTQPGNAVTLGAFVADPAAPAAKPPVASSPPQVASGSGAPTGRATLPAGLRIGSARRTRSTISANGTITTRATGSVIITYRARVAGRVVRAQTRSRLRAGRWQATLRLPRALARAPRGTLEVRYLGSSRVRGAMVRGSVTTRRAR